MSKGKTKIMYRVMFWNIVEIEFSGLWRKKKDAIARAKEEMADSNEWDFYAVEKVRVVDTNA